jgi:hypothetical protein
LNTISEKSQIDLVVVFHKIVDSRCYLAWPMLRSIVQNLPQALPMLIISIPDSYYFIYVWSVGKIPFEFHSIKWKWWNKEALQWKTSIGSNYPLNPANVMSPHLKPPCCKISPKKPARADVLL